MRKLLLFLFIIGGFLACTQGPDKAQIEALEKSFVEEATPENSKKLFDQYLAYVKANANDEATSSDYLYKAANLKLKDNQLAEAVPVLTQLIKSYPNSVPALRSAVSLSVIGANVEEAEGKAAKQLLVDGPLTLDTAIARLASAMYDDSTFQVDQSLAGDYITACEQYAKVMPDASKAPEYLLKGGETARAIRNFNKALSIYDNVLTNFPDHPKAAQALFLKAFTLDNDLNKSDEARPLYTSFLEKYPDNDFADDTQFLLNNLGKSDEEIIENFETMTKK